MTFTKMHGLGNDFILVEDLAGELDFSPAAVQWFCDRNFGIGADGLILVRPATSSEADFHMHYINADGTLAEMCGNGVRCFAKYLVDRELVAPERDRLVVETLGGLKPVSVERDDEGLMRLATVDMGAPGLTAEQIPTTLSADVLVDVPLETDAGTFSVTCVSMGNPHCIIWVDDVDNAPVETIGPLIEHADAFPNRTNVEFAEVADADLIRVRVWERGCGETLACGTGACATVVAAALAGKIGREATVELPGGELRIAWDGAAGGVIMTGPAEEVFAGVVDIPEGEDD